MPDAERLTVTAREAAALVGLHYDTFRERVQLGLTPAPIRNGRRMLFPRGQIVAWVEAGCPPRAEWEQILRRR